MNELASATVLECPDLMRHVARAVFDAAKVHHSQWLTGRSLSSDSKFAGGFTIARCACVSVAWRDAFGALWSGPTFASRDWAVRLVLNFVREKFEFRAMGDDAGRLELERYEKKVAVKPF